MSMTGPEGIDPWQRLSRVISRGAPGKGQVQVADSKKVKQGTHGMQRLERTVLSFWAAWKGKLPSSTEDLLEECGTDMDRLRSCPWYRDLSQELPLHSPREEIELGAHLLRRELDEVGIEILHMALRAVEVEEFNLLIERTDNKSRTHFHAYAEVIRCMLEHVPDGGHLVADRCGGRTHYAQALRDSCPGSRVQVIAEGRQGSIYRLDQDGRSLRLTFVSRGEERAFPTALASCAAKYLRELLIHALNNWFCSQVPGLRRTAGYYVDGKRFLNDIASFARSAELPMGRLVRSR
jgi:hypothetical protein